MRKVQTDAFVTNPSSRASPWRARWTSRSCIRRAVNGLARCAGPSSRYASAPA